MLHPPTMPLVSDPGPLDRTSGEPVRGHAVPRRPGQDAPAAGPGELGRRPPARPVRSPPAAQSEPNVDPLERIQLEQLARVAELQVADVTGLSTSADGPGRHDRAGEPRATWVARARSTPTGRCSSGWPSAHSARTPTRPTAPSDDRRPDGRPARRHHADARPDDAGDDRRARWSATSARRSFGQYDLPIPRPPARRAARRARRTSTRSPRSGACRPTTCGCGSACTSSPTTPCSACPTCGPASTSCSRDYVGGFRARPDGARGAARRARPRRPGGARRRCRRCSAIPRCCSAPSSRPTQRALLPRLEALVAVVVGYVDHVMDAVGAAARSGRYGMLTEALRRRRVEADAVRPLRRAPLGLELTQAQYDRGAAFVAGVVERAGARRSTGCGSRRARAADAGRGRRPRPLARPHRPALTDDASLESRAASAAAVGRRGRGGAGQVAERRRTAAATATDRKPRRGGQRQRHREERADHPDELEPGLEPGEGPAPVGVGRVALHERVEGQLAGARADMPTHERDERGAAEPAAATRRAHRGEHGRRQRAREDALLGWHARAAAARRSAPSERSRGRWRRAPPRSATRVAAARARHRRRSKPAADRTARPTREADG